MAQEQQLEEEERYQYIGFEAFGKKVKPFWKTGDERAAYLKELRAQEGSVFRKSVVYGNILSLSDRVTVTLASLLMIVAPFLAWFKVDTIYGPVSFSGITGVMHLDGFWFYVELIGGKIIPLAVYLTAALAYLSLVLGVLTLVALFLKSSSIEVSARRLKNILRLQIYPFLLFLGIIIVTAVGQQIPFGEHLGVYGLSGHFGMGTYLGFTSIGIWLSIFALLLNFNKSKEL
ncbi:MAG: hypothetical protein ABIJ61_07425 [bacterium]